MMMLIRMALLPMAVMLCGCTHYLYHGTIQAEDSAGVERETILYWTRTDPLVGPAKADTAVLRSACGTPVSYVTRPEGIVFIGTPGEDRPAGESESVERGQACGRFLDHERLVDVGRGAVELTVRCEPVTGEFSVGRAYLKAREHPYTFVMHVERDTSLFGNVFQAPVPECPEE